jgi:hypothetical protein
MYTRVLLNANSHNPIIFFIYCFKSIIKRPKKKVGMLKLQLILSLGSQRGKLIFLNFCFNNLKFSFPDTMSQYTFNMYVGQKK